MSAGRAGADSATNMAPGWGIMMGTIKKALVENPQVLVITGGRGGIRTRDLRLRRPTLYPAELPALDGAISIPYFVKGYHA